MAPGEEGGGPAHAGRAALTGLIIHIGLGYRFGLLITGIAIAAHLLVGVVARGWWRRRRST